MTIVAGNLRATVAARYDAANRQTLEWMLSRPALHGAFVDTKVNPLTGQDYGAADGLRGPDWTYGWIQGRALEALATFAQHYRTHDAALADRLTARLRPLYERLADMAKGGHVSFLYDSTFRPVRFVHDSPVAQTRPDDIYTYSDAFVAKGLVAAAVLIDRPTLPRHLDYLQRVIAAIGDGRFQIDEKSELCIESIAAQPDDFGPRMILLGAAGMLSRAGLGDHAEPWASRFIQHVLSRHFDPATGVLRNSPGENRFNAGHGIEFVGFALDHLGPDVDDGTFAQLATILDRSLAMSMRGQGVVLSVDLTTGAPLVPWHPWWCLPETIRACALALRRGDDPALRDWWGKADDAFFTNFWQPAKGYAYQTLTPDGPADYVPATPDLDVAYHTGLSLLAAQNAQPFA